MNKTLTAWAAALSALAISMAACSQPPTPMERINALIASGDTVAPMGLLNQFVVSGVELTPAMLDAGQFTTASHLSAIDVADSELSLLLRNSGHVALCHKDRMWQLFPHATEFSVDSQKVTRQEFARIPSALLLSVEATDSGRCLAATTRAAAHSPSTVARGEMERESEWLYTGMDLLPTMEGVMLNDISTYPADTEIFIDHMLRSRAAAEAIPVEQMASVSLMQLGGRPSLHITTRGSHHADSNDITKAVADIPSLRLLDVLKAMGRPVYRLTVADGSVYGSPVEAIDIYGCMPLVAVIKSAAGRDMGSHLLLLKMEADADNPDQLRLTPSAIDDALATRGYPADSIADITPVEAIGALIVTLK